MTTSRLAPPIPPTLFPGPDKALAAGDLAKAFLAQQWELSAADRTWLTVLSSSFQVGGWHRVEVRIFGCPDTWIFRVYDPGVCDPEYRFKAAEFRGGKLEYLSILPDAIAAMLLAEHGRLALPR